MCDVLSRDRLSRGMCQFSAQPMWQVIFDRGADRHGQWQLSVFLCTFAITVLVEKVLADGPCGLGRAALDLRCIAQQRAGLGLP